MSRSDGEMHAADHVRDVDVFESTIRARDVRRMQVYSTVHESPWILMWCIGFAGLVRSGLAIQISSETTPSALISQVGSFHGNKISGGMRHCTVMSRRMMKYTYSDLFHAVDVLRRQTVSTLYCMSLTVLRTL